MSSGRPCGRGPEGRGGREGVEAGCATGEPVSPKSSSAWTEPTPAGSAIPHSSFFAFSSSKISPNLAKLGLNLGRIEDEFVVSTNAMKHMEYDRLKVYPCASSRSVTTPLVDDEVNAIIDGQLLSHLVGEVKKVDLDEDELGSIYDLHASGRTSKSAKDKKNKKMKKVEKQPNYPIVSQ